MSEAGDNLEQQTGGDGTQAQDAGVGLTRADDGNAVNGAQDTPPAGEPQPSDKGDAQNGDADIPGLTTASGAKAGNDGDGDDKKGDGSDDGSDVEPKPYELHVPDGFALDMEMVDAATPLLQKYGVTNEDAQALADLVTQKVQKELDGFHERNGEMVEEWKRRLVADPEIGGKALKQNLGVGLKALNKFGDAELVQILQDSGLEYHPAVVRFFHKVGSAISEDAYIGRGMPQRAKDTASLLYGGEKAEEKEKFRMPLGCDKYLRLKYEVTGTFTGGTLEGYLTPDVNM